MKRFINRIILAAAAGFIGAGNAMAADELTLEGTVAHATVEFYVSDAVPTESAPGTSSATVLHDQYVVAKVTPDADHWIYNEMITFQVAGGSGGAGVRPLHALKLPVNPTALTTNLADGTGYYYYQIPSECTKENGYTHVIIDGSASSKIDLSTAEIDGSGKVITASDGGWTAKIEVDKVEWIYDGTEHGPVITNFSLSNGTTTFTNTAQQVKLSGSKTNANDYTATLSAVTNGCFKSSKAVPFKIEQKPLTITADNATKVYDGTALTNNNYTCSPSTLPGDDKIESVTITGSQTFVGSSDNVPSAAVIKNSSNTNVTSNYNITYENGTLKVLQASVAITITAASQTWTYDGNTHSDATVTVTSGSLLTDDALVATATGSVKNVVDTSTGNNPIATGYKIMHGGTDVTANYVITPVAGTLTITPKAVTLTSGSKSREYNGSALTNAEVEGKNANGLTTETGWVGSEGATYNFTGTQTAVGSSANAFTYTLKTGTIATNYTITKTEGTLEVTANSTAITVVPGSGTKVYDGTPLTKTAQGDFNVTGVPTGFTWTATADGTVTNVVPGAGEKAVNAVTEFKIFDAGSNDVTDQFSNIDKSATGTLTITPKAVTLTSGSKSREYNGSALTNAEVEGKNANGLTVETGWVGSEGATYNFTGTQTAVGSSANAFSYTLKSGTIASNYNISKTEGTLTITASTTAIKVVPGSGTKVYDGTPLTKTAHEDFNVTGVPTGFTWTATADGTVTNVVPGAGEKAVNAVTEFKIFDAGSNDVTDQFSKIDKSATGTLTITPKAVTLTSGSKNREYNGSALTNAEVEGKNANGLTVETGWVGSEGATYNFTGTQTIVGSSANAFSYTLKSGTIASNYTITKTEGTLTITASSTAIKVVPGSGTKVYDGTPLTKTAHEDFTVTGVPDGFTWTATADGTVTNVVPGAGEKAVNAVTEFKIFDAGSNDVTNQFSKIDKSATGTLTITPKAVTLTSGSKSREYNGSALTNAEVEGKNANGLTTETGWVGSEGATYDFTGTQTIVGSSANAFSYTLKSGTIASNYTITKTEGTLTITASSTAIKVVPGSGTKVYDGTPLTKTAQGDFTVTGVPTGFTWTATADGTVTNVVPGTGEKAVNAVTEFKIFDAGSKDVTDQFSNIDKSATGTLTITPKNISGATVTVSQDTYEYDGSEKKPDVTSVVLESVTLNKGTDYTVTGYANNIAAGTATVTVTGKGNYTGTADGHFTITTTTGELTFSDITKTYGDAPFDVAPNTVVSPGAITYASGNTAVVTVSGKTLTIVGQGVAVITATQAASGSYNEQQKTFKVTVNKAALTITANNQTIDYGSSIALGTSKITPTGLKGTDAVSSITLTPSTADVTSSGTITPSNAVVKNGDKDVTANYTITYETGNLTIEYAITLPAGYSTFCAPFDLLLTDGLQAYTVMDVNEKGVELEEQTAIGKNVPMILANTTARTLKLRKAPEQTFSSTNNFVGVTDAEGTDVSTINGNVYVLRNGQFVWSRSGVIPQYRCYIILQNKAGARLMIVEGDEATEIEEVREVNEVKEGDWYTLDGKKLDIKPTKKGLYILMPADGSSQGKKVMIK